ncbi:hypothetical protein CTAYLR_006989 [Chrysophaeum taylorii]|uniref:Uncharacterized protein n=1 Tax=Chrysophaeum taylorii TaxID=2483200 RepID=A0AAD7UBY0_9STRA|nr:hypothetical protein CTAYLR_006989 [Chrysophaeum taylorii]
MIARTRCLALRAVCGIRRTQWSRPVGRRRRPPPRLEKNVEHDTWKISRSSQQLHISVRKSMIRYMLRAGIIAPTPEVVRKDKPRRHSLEAVEVAAMLESTAYDEANAAREAKAALEEEVEELRAEVRAARDAEAETCRRLETDLVALRAELGDDARRALTAQLSHTTRERDEARGSLAAAEKEASCLRDAKARLRDELSAAERRATELEGYESALADKDKAITQRDAWVARLESELEAVPRADAALFTQKFLLPLKQLQLQLLAIQYRVVIDLNELQATLVAPREQAPSPTWWQVLRVGYETLSLKAKIVHWDLMVRSPLPPNCLPFWHETDPMQNRINIQLMRVKLKLLKTAHEEEEESCSPVCARLFSSAGMAEKNSVRTLVGRRAVAQCPRPVSPVLKARGTLSNERATFVVRWYSGAAGVRWSSSLPPPPNEHPKPRRSMVSNLLGVGAIVYAIGKVKYVLLALKLTKMAPVLSMVASSAAYSFVFGPAYGCGMVGLILCHECGHAIAMHHYGVPFSPMVFIPFMGASIVAEKHPKSAFEDVVISLAGPVVGSLAAGGLAIAGHASESQLLMALADWGFLINLFNLLPIGSLDGGRVADALSPWLPAFGLAGGCGLVYAGAVTSPLFYLILLTAGFQVGSRVFGVAEPKPWKRLVGAQMYAVFAAYAGLVTALLLAKQANNYGRKSPRQLEAEQRGETIDLPPGADCYDDYFATFSGTNDDDDSSTWA